MIASEITANDIVSFGDVKYLAAVRGPCITMVVDIPKPRELATRLKNAGREVEKRLTDWGLDDGASKTLLEPIRDLGRSMEDAGIWANALILFRSPDVFRHFLLHRSEPAVESVEGRFQVGQLLSALTREQRFYVLGLSRGRIRLLRCTQHRAEQEALRGLVPADMKDWLHIRTPDHMLQNRSTSGPDTGSMKGVTFGTSTDREREDQYMAHFYKAVDEGVNTLVRGNAAPLLLAGVEEEVDAYRRVSVYSRMFHGAVHCSADSLSDAELHKRALEVVMREPSAALENSLSHFAKHRDDRLILSEPGAVIKAAWEGRLSYLFLAEGAEYRGAWKADVSEVDLREPHEDLLNAAALQTVLHGGQSFVLKRDEMPLDRDVAAVLRF
jgi:Bacterial archaeo-eukaryotic release factor family 3